MNKISKLQENICFEPPSSSYGQNSFKYFVNNLCLQNVKKRCQNVLLKKLFFGHNPYRGLKHVFSGNLEFLYQELCNQENLFFKVVTILTETALNIDDL